MSESYLTSISSATANFPKKLLIWNYWDHEHVVGTHFEHYKKVEILFEDRNTCISERLAKLPYIPFYFKMKDELKLTNENQMEVLHTAFFNIIKCKQKFIFEENENSCKVTRYDYLKVPNILKFLQPLFDKLMKKWFVDVWNEDMPMRERRYKVWKLGFKDFKGIDYVNNPDLKKKELSERKYEVILPIPKTNQNQMNSSKKVFKRIIKNSKHIGYCLPDL